MFKKNKAGVERNVDKLKYFEQLKENEEASKLRLGLDNVATNNFSDAIYSDPDFFEAYYSRGICFEKLGNIAQAESDYKRSIELNPEYTYEIEALEELIYKNKNYNK